MRRGKWAAFLIAFQRVVSRHQQTTLSYKDLDAESNALARGLKNVGVEKGDRVAVSLGNNIEYATVSLSSLLSWDHWTISDQPTGNICMFQARRHTSKSPPQYPPFAAVQHQFSSPTKQPQKVPLNPAFNAHQVIAALTHLGATHLLIGTETHLPWKSPRSNIPLLTHLVPNLAGNKCESALVPSLKHVILVNNSSGRVSTADLKATAAYKHVLEDGGVGMPLRDQGLSAGEVVNIQFTSGTTSMPKAACLTHRSILNNGKSIGDRLGLTERDVVCCPPPLFQYVVSFLLIAMFIICILPSYSLSKSASFG